MTPPGKGTSEECVLSGVSSRESGVGTRGGPGCPILAVPVLCGAEVKDVVRFEAGTVVNGAVEGMGAMGMDGMGGGCSSEVELKGF